MTGLAGRRALVTGASAGIGRACALALAASGAHVVATGRRRAALDSLLADIAAAGGTASAEAGDITDPGFIAALADAAGAVDILVNNAAVLTYAPFVDMDDADMVAMVETNILAPLRLTQRVARGMLARGAGHIVVITSGSARMPVKLGLVYSATKQAMSAMAGGLRLELQASGIRVTEIAPGSVETGIRDSSTHPAFVERQRGRGYRLLSPEDVADAVIYAVSAPAHCAPNLIELKPIEAPVR